MTERILNRDLVLQTLDELKSKDKTAKRFAISKETLNRRLKSWGVFEQYLRIPKPKPNMKRFEVGERVFWIPVKCRDGFFGLAEGHAPWPCIIVSGPSSIGLYEVRYDGPDRKRRAGRTLYSVGAKRLYRTPHPEQENE